MSGARATGSRVHTASHEELCDTRGEGPKLRELMLGWGDWECLGFEGQIAFCQKEMELKRASQVEGTVSARAQRVRDACKKWLMVPPGCHLPQPP